MSAPKINYDALAPSPERVSISPWADPNHDSYRISRKPGKHRCLGCGCDCTYTAWGSWCYSCNVPRMKLINHHINNIGLGTALGMMIEDAVIKAKVL
jgi:hypothetical protein